MKSFPLDINAFISKWWTSSSPLSLEVEEGINESYLGDEVFWKDAVFSQQNELLPPSKSHFGKTYNFYHDCILRHIKTNAIAFSVVTGRYPENWTYEKLHTCVNYHVDKWASHHLQPGDLIAIIGEPNIRFILALLTAFRFGLKIIYLPTNSPFLGKGQIIKFLTEIKPSFIVTEDPSFNREGVKSLTINENGSDDENHEPCSFDYPAASELQITFSLQQQEALTLTSLEAHWSYLNALRDALFTFNLNQHPYWAAPLTCPLSTEPCSTLISLLSGATKVYVSDDAIQNNPRLIEDERVNIIALSNDLQQLWTQKPGMPTRYLKYYYKSPLDTQSQAWKTFIQLNKLEKVPQFDIVMDNTLGGAILFSRPSMDPNNVFLKPTLGTSWYLSHINRSGQESLTGYGIFEIAEQTADFNFSAMKVENHLMLTSVLEPSRFGVIFPIEDIEKSISLLPFVEDCMLHPIRKVGSPFSYYFILLIFVDPLKEEFEAEKWTEEIHRQISSNLGRGYLPDKIEYFSLVPRKNILGLDKNWCANQYNSGLLFQKKKSTEYQLLSVLKKLIQEFTIANQEVR